MRVSRSARIGVLMIVIALGSASAWLAPRRADATEPKVICIDAGHQARGDKRLEPIGPGSKKKKPRVTSGTSGTATHRSESSVNLKVALKLRTELEKRGYKVVMVRTKQKVNIANSKRAKIANKAHADLFIRLHCDSSTDHSIKGLLTIVPAKNKWTGKIVKRSARAGAAVRKATLKTTKAKDRGISKRSDMSGFNYAKVPAIIVEMGVMSNAREDRKLITAAYQRKLVTGMANGIDAYFK
jgi:N-acetylmuramoyl-L-alanine amidase